MPSRPPSAVPVTRLATLAICTALMTGCQSFTASSSAHLRVIDLSVDAGPVDIYQGTHGIAFNLGYGAVTSYVTLPPSSPTITVASAGSKQALSAAKTTLLAGGQYTLLVGGPLVGLQQTLLSDQPPASLSTIRILHQAERTGPIDVYLVPAGHRLATTTPIAVNLAAGAVTGYLPVPVGVAAAIVLPAGTHASAAALAIALHTGRQIEYARGSARTLILLDAPVTLTGSLDVVETVDSDPPQD